MALLSSFIAFVTFLDMSVAFEDEQYAKTQRRIIVDVLLVVTMLSADQANAIILVVESSAPARPETRAHRS